jgi:hypothetical protein
LLDVSGDPAWGEGLVDQSAAEPDGESEATASARLSPWFLAAIVLVQVVWLGGLAYLLVRVVQ